MARTRETPNAELAQAQEALNQDIERHAAIASKAHESTLIPGSSGLTAYRYDPDHQAMSWHTDPEDEDYSYKIEVGVAPGWRHTTLFVRTDFTGDGDPLEGPLAYIVHDDDRNVVEFRHGEAKQEAHSGIIETLDLMNYGVAYAIVSSRDTGPETLDKIERAVNLVHQGETEKEERHARMAAIGGVQDLLS